MPSTPRVSFFNCWITSSALNLRSDLGLSLMTMRPTLAPVTPPPAWPALDITAATFSLLRMISVMRSCLATSSS